MTRERITALLSPALLTAVFFGLWAVFRSRFLINWDAGQFALGTVNYSLANHTPHPPGYYLFVVLGKKLSVLTGDTNFAFVAIAGAATLASVLILYATVVRISRSRMVALAAALLFLVHPFTIFHGATALTYAFEALAALSTYALTLHVRETRRALPFFIACGLTAALAGFRPSIILVALPMIALQALYVRSHGRTLLCGIGVGAMIASLWLIPFVIASGGMRTVLDAVISQARLASVAKLADTTSWSLATATLPLAWAPLVALILLFPKEIRSIWERVPLRLALIPVATQLAIYAFLHFGEVGYIMSILPFGVIFAMPFIERCFHSRHTLALLITLIGLTGALNMIPADFVPYRKISASLPSHILEHDAKIAETLSIIRSTDPRTTFIAVLRGQYLDQSKRVRVYPSQDIRLLAYYVPDITLTDLLGVPGLYVATRNYRTTEHSSTSIPFSGSVQKLIVFADYLHPESYPKGLQTQEIRGSAPQYVADLAGINSFEFLGFTFQRE